MYRVRIETTQGIILLGVTRALAPRDRLARAEIIEEQK